MFTENGKKKIEGIETEQLWTVIEASEYFQLSPETIRSLARRGEIPAFKIGRSWRFRKSELIKLTKSKQFTHMDLKGN